MISGYKKTISQEAQFQQLFNDFDLIIIYIYIDIFSQQKNLENL